MPKNDLGSPSAIAGCYALVHNCGNLRPGEKALVVSDETTRRIGEAIADAARDVSSNVEHCVIKQLTMHGQEPPEEVAVKMAQSSLVFGVTSMSMAHSQARFRASQAGARYLSLPEYTVEVLTSPALRTDFQALTPLATRLAGMLTNANVVSLRTSLGTDLTCNIRGRTGNVAPGWCWGPGVLASPPDAEVNIPPLENGSDGIVVIDGSIPCPELGLLKSPLHLVIQQGIVVDVQGDDASSLNRIYDGLKDPSTRVVAEFGIGLNPQATLRGSMLEDEGCLGTVHLGMGSNATMGGQNSVAFHLDHIIRDGTVSVDGVPIIEMGRMLESVTEGITQ